MKKSILFNAYEGDNWIGGLYYKKNIAFQLSCSEMISNKVKFLIITSSNHDSFNGLPDKIKIIKLSKGKMYRLWKLIIIFLYSVKYEFPLYRNRQKLSIININWIPDFQHKYYPQYFTNEEINARDKKYNNYASSEMPIILSSIDCLKDFRNYYSRTKKNVYVVPFVSYIEPEIRCSSIQMEKKILADRNITEKKYAVIMNQFWQHKNHIVIFEAIKKYLEQNSNSDFQFIFTGKMEDYRNPDYIGKLKAIANEPQVFSHIRIFGFIDRTEQIVLMKNAAYVIQPSLFEGWGTVVEDAKVLDKTILLSDIPVHREQMNGKCILFDPHDSAALATLIEEENKKEHHDDVEKGIADMYKRAKEYSVGFEQLLKDLEKQ